MRIYWLVTIVGRFVEKYIYRNKQKAETLEAEARDSGYETSLDDIPDDAVDRVIKDGAEFSLDEEWLPELTGDRQWRGWKPSLRAKKTS